MRVRGAGLIGAVTATAVALGAGVAPSALASDRHDGRDAPSKHVLLVSVDGLHQADLAQYVRTHPRSALASLVSGGTQFTGAQTPVPSDSFPGMVAQVTGGDPRTTGVYYDNSYNRTLLPAGTTSCAGVEPGAEVTYFEALDKDPKALDAGQGLAGLPASILSMTGNPRTVMDPTQLPVDPSTCTPVYPHDYLKVNTIFQVARQAGLRTAWSDKHAAYDILNGPTSAGSPDPSIQDLFTPEINADATGYAPGADWTKDNAATQQYDGYKVQAVLNEIDGYDHSRSTSVGVPAIFGMNFQTISTAQKLPTSGGLAGGYLADGVTPGPVLGKALDFINDKVGSMVDELRRTRHTRDTTIILSAKHGQSPTQPAALTRISDGPIIDGLDAAWAVGHPGVAPLVAQATDDDAMIMWFSDRSPAAATFAKNYLLQHNGTGNDITGAPKAYTGSGLATVHAGAEAARYFGTSTTDDRVPDLYAVAQHGTVFTGGKGKIAEHGGADPQDRNVPIVVSGAGAPRGEKVGATVETTAIAPTILALLGLDPAALQAVRIQHTTSLVLHRDDGQGRDR